MRKLPPRLWIALGATALALVVLVVIGLGNSDGDSNGKQASQTSETVPITEPATSAPATSSTSVVIPPDWYPKKSSRYSDRRPPVTVTTLRPTTSQRSPESRPSNEQN